MNAPVSMHYSKPKGNISPAWTAALIFFLFLAFNLNGFGVL